ncbi:hypothetical protein R1flu_001154 [Riccia fluitans]|uniref:Uncharacterized protein n=1 Tax=Riccia fluitans TaxID=41844 RepID=A0ABD1Y3H0_9MARC
MILAYLRGLHGHGYNWANAILHGLRNEIHFLQSRARSNEGGKPIPVVWAPCFVHILFGLRHNLFVGTPLEEAEGWPVLTRRPRAEDKQPEEFVPASPEQPVSSQRPEDIPIASPEQPVSSKRARVEDKERGLPSKKKNKVINSRLLPYVQARIQRHIVAIDMWKKAYEVELSKVRELQATNDGLRGQLAAKDAAKLEVYALAPTEVHRELEEFKRSVTKLEDFKRLEEEASHLREALAAKESVVQALENARHKEISTLKATCRKYKTSLDGEIGTNADLQARVLNLQDELSTCKYTQEQALQGQKSARAELLEVKKELRMLQVLHQDVDEGNAASAP